MNRIIQKACCTKHLQIPSAKMEKDIIDLNATVLIVGQGLWYPMEYPHSSYYEVYKRDLHEKMKEFVALHRKVTIIQTPDGALHFHN